MIFRLILTGFVASLLIIGKVDAIEINVQKNSKQLTALTFTAPLGFMKVRNLNDLSMTGFYIKHKSQNKDLTIYNSPSTSNAVGIFSASPLSSTILYDKVVNDIDNPGQQVRRIKVKFSNSVTTYIRNNLPQGKGQYDVFLINSNGEIISDAAETASEKSMPVEFKGGNGDPLQIFLEFSAHFDFRESRILDVDKIYLTLTNKNFLAPKIRNTISATPLVAYDQTGHIFSTFAGKKPANSYISSEKNSLFIEAITIYNGDFYYSNYRKRFTQIGFLPNVIITHDLFNSKKPKSGWYEISLQAQDLHYLYRQNLVLKPRYLLNNTPIFDKTPIDQQITGLITQVNTRDGNRSFAPQKLASEVFHHQRFYIVSSYDSKGRIRLQPIESPHAKAPNPEFTLYLNEIADGNMVWYGSAVRWFSAGKENSLVVRDGYLGWHDPNGKYAFLRLHNGAAAIGDAAPKVGTVFAFNFAKITR
ncbi:MAG: hypothetical protein ACPGUD_07490 [Parashewanella sp.]